jgi:Flp pilus assembly pilin Flp
MESSIVLTAARRPRSTRPVRLLPRVTRSSSRIYPPRDAKGCILTLHHFSSRIDAILTGPKSVLSPAEVPVTSEEELMSGMWNLLMRLWADDSGQDVAEYAVMLAVILVIVVGTLKLIGGQSNNIFSAVASSIQ